MTNFYVGCQPSPLSKLGGGCEKNIILLTTQTIKTIRKISHTQDTSKATRAEKGCCKQAQECSKLYTIKI